MSCAYLVIAKDHSGLTNQLYNLVCGIIRCIQERKTVLIIGPFLMQIHTTNFCPISRIIHFPLFASFLQRQFKITIVDSYSLKMNRFFRKKIIHVDNWNMVSTCLFNSIIKQIKFVPFLVKPAFQFIISISPDNIFNVIHLRLETDAIAHWSKVNKITEDDFLKRLTETYIDLIQKHIKRDQMTIILSGSYENDVIQFLKNNGYIYSYLKKNSGQYREINAVLDMIIGKQCSGTFIGCGGSTFSDLICNILPANIPKYLLNINNI